MSTGAGHEKSHAVTFAFSWWNRLVYLPLLMHSITIATVLPARGNQNQTGLSNPSSTYSGTLSQTARGENPI